LNSHHPFLFFKKQGQREKVDPHKRSKRKQLTLEFPVLGLLRFKAEPHTRKKADSILPMAV